MKSFPGGIIWGGHLERWQEFPLGEKEWSTHGHSQSVPHLCPAIEGRVRYIHQIFKQNPGKGWAGKFQALLILQLILKRQFLLSTVPALLSKDQSQMVP